MTTKTREVDIRTENDVLPISSIRVANDGRTCYMASVISNELGSIAYIKSCAEGTRTLRVRDEAHARNLIIGLERAIAEGFFE